VHDLHRILLSSEVRDLTDEVARLFEELDRQAPRGQQAPAGTCTPALDVLETESTVEIVMDVPGIAASSLRVLIKRGVLVVVGQKTSPYAGQPVAGTFHLVERGFGQFARAVRLDGAFDGGRAQAVLEGGELRVVLPKIEERRGQEIHVPIATP
jgi:HSP20 family protein